MDGLLIALFVLFSIFSAIAERRKRKRRAEEAESRQQERAGQAGSRQQERAGQAGSQQQERAGQAGSQQPEETKGEEEWPFPMPGGDPFETQSRGRTQVQEEDEEDEEEDEEAEERAARAREIQRLTQAAQETTLQEEWEARQLKRRSAVEEVGAGTEQVRYRGKRRTLRGWKLDARSARRAVVYAEILGRPRAERMNEGPPGARSA